MKTRAMWTTALAVGVLSMVAPAAHAVFIIPDDYTWWGTVQFVDLDVHGSIEFYLDNNEDFYYTNPGPGPSGDFHAWTYGTPTAIMGLGEISVSDNAGGFVESIAPFSLEETTTAWFTWNEYEAENGVAELILPDYSRVYFPDSVPSQEITLLPGEYWLHVRISCWPWNNPEQATYGFELTTVPEPMSMVMLGCLGLGMVAARKLRRNKA